VSGIGSAFWEPPTLRQNMMGTLAKALNRWALGAPD
jgi:hypothetical protein